MTTLAPSFANNTETARPIPLSPPVIIAVLPSNFFAFFGLSKPDAGPSDIQNQAAGSGAEAVMFSFFDSPMKSLLFNLIML